MQPGGGGGPWPSWLRRPLPRSRLPAASHPGPGRRSPCKVPAPAGKLCFSPAARPARPTPSGPGADFAFALRPVPRAAPARGAPPAPAASPSAASPQPLLALLRGELVEGLGVLLAQEGLVVVLEALVVLGRPLAQVRVGPHHALLAHGGLGPQRRRRQQQRQQQPQGQPQVATAAAARHRPEESAARGKAPSERRAAAREWGLRARAAAAGLGPGPAPGGRGRAGPSASARPVPELRGAPRAAGRRAPDSPAHEPIGRRAAGGGRSRGATSPARVVGAGLGFRLGPSPRSRSEGRAQADWAGDWRAP